MAATSGAYTFQPDVATLVGHAYARIQVRRNQITYEHLADARVAINLLLSDWAANRGVNLAQVDQISFGLVAGLATYTLPANTVDLLDTYLRTYTPSTTTTVNLGNALTAVVDNTGVPVISGPYGDPVVSAPGGGALSSVAGSDTVTLKWPAHGLIQGSPIFFGSPVTIGGITAPPLVVVSNVVDGNNVQFMVPAPAFETQNNQGGTPLFYVPANSSTVTVIQPGHGQQVGQSYKVPIAITVGNLTIAAGSTFTVAAVQSLSQFTFVASGTSTITGVAFENGGQINVATQAAGVSYSDVPLFPLSRNDYSALANKFVPGRPTSYWIDRVVPPQVSFYPVASGTQNWGFVAYRMREVQDAIPAGGQTMDLPRRMLPAFTAQLAADLAEIWAPALWVAKQAEADKAWLRAASADVERANLHIVPLFNAYYR